MQCIIHNAFLAGFLWALAFIRPLGAEPIPLTIAPEPFGEDTLSLTLQTFISSARESPDLEGLIELMPMKYSEEEIIDALSSGEIDIALVTTEQIELRQDQLGPQPVVLFNQPAIFANIDDIAVVENSWLGDAALSELANANVLGLAYWNLGMTQFAANEPLGNVEDFSGREIGTASALKHEIFQEFGAAPILLHPFDLGPAMSSRTADAVEISMEAALDFRDAFTHVVEANYRPLVAILAANREKWHSLPDQAQVALADLARFAGQQSIAIAASATEDARAMLNEQGVMFTSLDAESRQALREASLTTWREQPEIVADYLTDTLSLVEVSRTDSHRQEPPGPPTPQSPQPRRGENLELEILFASDRNDEKAWYPGKPIKPMFRMGSKRDHSERYCGIVRVKVDPKRPMANEDSKFFEIGEFELIDWGIDGAQCRELLLKKVSLPSAPGVLIFVHGYNNTFYEAVKRAASFAKDIEFPGVTMIWSWPAAGGVTDYGYDEDSAAWTKPHFRDLLTKLAEFTGRMPFHLISHSMGARIVIDVLEPLPDPVAGGGWPLFNHLIFAAPDVATDVFRDQSPRARRFANWSTLYASSDDRALNASAKLHKAPRAGLGGVENIVVQNGLDSVDATGLYTEFLSVVWTRHAYVFDRPKAVSDLRALIVNNVAPKERGLKEEKKNNLPYWRLSP